MWAALSHGVAAKVTVHVKEGLYYNRYPMDVFFFFGIEVFGCLHQQSDNFLH